MTLTSSSAASLLALTLLYFSISAYPCFAKCHVDDETGLLAFKAGITQDPMGMLSSWISGSDCCTWNGITCLANKRVYGLSVYEGTDPIFSLSGTISPSLSKVQYLRGLNLQNLQNLTGTFPTFIFNLPDLNTLSLDNNKLSGPLPLDIGQKLYRRLVDLSLSQNQFTGPIPSSISQLIHLRNLDLGSNLFSGLIPSGIQQMKHLVFLNLEKNQLSGKIPDFFTPLTFLRKLDLSHNKFSGEFPPSIAFLAPRLELLDLGYNLLTGKIPDYLGNFQKLDRLDLSYNQLTGVVPKNFRNLTDILYLELGHNHLVDPFPEMIVKFNFGSLDLSYNKFNLGTIPKWVESSTLIQSLKLAGCGLKFRLEDFKPSEKHFFNYIDLSDNQISGTPVGLMNETTLLQLFWASGNQLQFNLSDLRLPDGLKTLVLARNQIFGKVPQNISRLEKGDLSHNHLCGPIPTTKLPVRAFIGNDCLCGSPLPPCRN
ncbi:hypothetical protein AQUCO_05800143v1 [Aquilegia coerulea]|uniref:Leucine-rich repeat-containing N-terminal plant-type domain-containing protein n=1 Tax=Aquilegia coerulea TaxID=218851 RepID=A0A2G5CF29_AQUCA|nr:hypothetical protein AQUCO_05800143v1 [Aquilegia coerulea]